MTDKLYLKCKLITIYKDYESYDLISLYRNLLKYNKDIRRFINNNELYEKYINELYNIIDEYAYGNENNDIEKIKDDFIIIIQKVINNL